MSTILVSKQTAIEELARMANEIVACQEKMQKLGQNYNKMLQDHFHVVDDGKPLSKIELIQLIQRVQAIPKLL